MTLRRWLALGVLITLAGCLPTGPWEAARFGTATLPPTYWDSTWTGLLGVQLDGRSSARPCTLRILGRDVRGNYDGLPFRDCVLDSEGARDVFNTVHVLLTLPDLSFFSVRLERYSTSNVMTAYYGSYYVTSLGQQFPADGWWCKGCTIGSSDSTLGGSPWLVSTSP